MGESKREEKYDDAIVEFDEEKHCDENIDLNNLDAKQLYSLLHEEEKANRMAQDDIKLLTNRINHLKKEFNAAKVKISETEEKTKSIINSKTSRIIKQKQKEEIVHNKQELLENGTDSLLKQRELSKKKREQLSKRQAEEKRSLIRSQQEEKLKLKKEKEKLDKLNFLEKQRKHEQRRKYLEEKKAKERKRQEELEKKKLNAQVETFRQIKGEIKTKAQEIEELERMELELIEQLKKAQISQRGAYMRLETALQE